MMIEELASTSRVSFSSLWNTNTGCSVSRQKRSAWSRMRSAGAAAATSSTDTQKMTSDRECVQ